MDIIPYRPDGSQKKTAPAGSKRVITTCIPCRTTKRRCNRDRPTCSLCLHLGIRCYYLTPNSDAKAPGRDQQVAPITGATGLSLPSAQTTNSVSSTAWKDQLQEIFWSVYLPKDESDSSLGNMFAITTQFSVLQQAAVRPGYLQSAAQALVLTALGHREENSQLLQQGMLSYGQCLGQLNNDLKAGRKATLEAAMDTCQLLCLYEMMRPVSSEGLYATRKLAWSSHATATCELYDMLAKQNSGANRYLDVDDRIFRLTFRNNFSARSPRCLAIYNLKQTSAESISGVTRNTLHFIMAKIPALFMRGDKLMEELNGSPTTTRLNELEDEGVNILNAYLDLGLELREWSSKILAIHSQETAGSRPMDRNEESDLCSISQQHGIGFLLTINEYWTCQMVINFQAQHFVHLMQSKTGMVTPALPDWMKDVRSFLSNIAESAHILLSTTAGLWVSEQAFFCVASAIHMTAALQLLNSKESLALIESVNTNKKGQIAFTRDFLVSITNESTPPDLKGDMDDPVQHHHMGVRWFGH